MLITTFFIVINGTHKSVQETSYAPAAVINALKRLGWVIPAGEQDAHELLNVILTTLDEEIQKMSRKVCIENTFTFVYTNHLFVGWLFIRCFGYL